MEEPDSSRLIPIVFILSDKISYKVVSSSSSEGTHSLHFYNPLSSLSLSQLSIGHNNFLGAVVLCSWVARMREVERLFLKSERQSAGFFWSLGGLGVVGILLYFRARVSSIVSSFR